MQLAQLGAVISARLRKMAIPQIDVAPEGVTSIVAKPAAPVSVCVVTVNGVEASAAG